jgi:hypothetical protein
MKIKLLTPELYAELKAIADQYPELTFHNVGYQYLKVAVREAHKEQLDRIAEILKEHIVGFVKFYNFRRAKDGSIALRFDYNWGAAEDTRSFTGVGYVKLDHLLHGFPEGATLC